MRAISQQISLIWGNFMQPNLSNNFFEGGSTSRKCDCVILECSGSPGAQCPSTVPTPAAAGQTTGAAWARSVQKSPLKEIKDCTEKPRKPTQTTLPKAPKKCTWERTKEEGWLILSLHSQQEAKLKVPYLSCSPLFYLPLSNLVPMHSSFPGEQRDDRKYKILDLWKMIWAFSIDMWV